MGLFFAEFAEFDLFAAFGAAVVVAVDVFVFEPEDAGFAGFFAPAGCGACFALPFQADVACGAGLFGEEEFEEFGEGVVDVDGDFHGGVALL